MHKNFKRIMSVLLCIVMLCSVPMCATAATTYKTFNSVFSIGDSNTMGYGLKGYKDYVNRDYLHGLKGTFTAYVRDYLNVDSSKCNTMTYPGLRTKDALYYLGGNVSMTGDEYFAKYSTKSWPESLITDNGKKGTNFQNQLKAKSGDKKLVLIATGPADVFYSAAETTSFSGAMGKLLAVPTMLEKMRANYNEFLEMYPKLLERVKKLNPNCTIVIVGYYNPFKNLKLSDLSLTSFFDAAAVISDDMNAHFKSWAKEYGCLYADITNAETYTLEKGLTLEDLLSDGNGKIYHLTADGHRYVARQILALLKAKPDPVTTKLTVDLGSVKSVSKVLLDGKAVSDYSYSASNHKLVVPCSVKTAKTLTVTELFKDGNTYVAKYNLSWDSSVGYVAHCESMTKSVGGINSSFLSGFLSLFDSFRNIFASIFSWVTY